MTNAQDSGMGQVCTERPAPATTDHASNDWTSRDLAENSGECWRESTLQQRLRRSIRRLAVNSGLCELFGSCEHREFVDDLEAKLLLADSPEMFQRVAHAIGSHLRGCRSAAADPSPVAKGIRLYAELNAREPGAERAAGDFLAEVASPQPPRPAPAGVVPRPALLDIASSIGFAIVGGAARRRARGVLIAAAKHLFRSARDRRRRQAPARLSN
jgi:hypothetical protein